MPDLHELSFHLSQTRNFSSSETIFDIAKGQTLFSFQEARLRVIVIMTVEECYDVVWL